MTDNEIQILKRLRTESSLRGTLTQCRARIRELVSEKYAMAIATENEIAELKKIHVGIIDKANHLADIAQIRQFERDEQAKINAALQSRIDNLSADHQRLLKEVSALREWRKDDGRTIASQEMENHGLCRRNTELTDKIKALEARTMWDFIRQAFREKPSIVIPRAEFRVTKETIPAIKDECYVCRSWNKSAPHSYKCYCGACPALMGVPFSNKPTTEPAR